MKKAIFSLLLFFACAAAQRIDKLPKVTTVGSDSTQLVLIYGDAGKVTTKKIDADVLFSLFTSGGSLIDSTLGWQAIVDTAPQQLYNYQFDGEWDGWTDPQTYNWSIGWGSASYYYDYFEYPESIQSDFEFTWSPGLYKINCYGDGGMTWDISGFTGGANFNGESEFYQCEDSGSAPLVLTANSFACYIDSLSITKIPDPEPIIRVSTYGSPDDCTIFEVDTWGRVSVGRNFSFLSEWYYRNEHRYKDRWNITINIMNQPILIAPNGDEYRLDQ